jgi:tetratricopeptide (TPR) repeat protein
MDDVDYIVNGALRSLVDYFFDYSQADLDAVLRKCEWALNINPNHARAHEIKGLAEFESGRTDQALEDLTRAINLERKDEYYNNRGDVYRQLGRFDEAIEDFTAAIEIDPDSPLGHFNLALTYNQSGEFIEAYRNLMKAQVTHSLDGRITALEDPAINFQLGDAYLGQGIIESAIEHYETAARILDQRGVTGIKDTGEINTAIILQNRLDALGMDIGINYEDMAINNNLLPQKKIEALKRD